MDSDQNFADFVVEQIENAGEITIRKMFREYAIFSNGKIFGLIGDNKLFIKPTEGRRAFIGSELVDASPFPTAKSKVLIEEKIEYREWLS